MISCLLQELESVHEDVQAMSECCEEMTNRLKVCLICRAKTLAVCILQIKCVTFLSQAAKEQTQDLIVKTNKLQSEK